MRIRIVPTASGKKAIQVVSKLYGKVRVHKHIGSYATDEEKFLLLSQAETFIRQGQTNLFETLSTIRLIVNWQTRIILSN